MNIERRGFAAALADVHKQARVDVAVDDWPQSKGDDFSARGTIASVMDAIGERFDYVWRRDKGRGIVLVKRFKNPDERPQIDANESRDVAANIVRTLQHLNTRPDPRGVLPTLRALFSTLTPQQYALASDGRSLRVRDLTKAQQQLVTAAVIHDSFGRIFAHIDTLASALSSLESATIESAPTVKENRAASSDPHSGQQFVITWRRKGIARRLTVPNHRTSFELQEFDGDVSPAPIPRTDNLSEASAAALHKRINLDLGSSTLGELAQVLAKDAGLRIEPLEPLRAHRVVMFAHDVTIDGALDLICDATGLEWKPAADDRIIVFRSRPVPVRSLPDICAAVRASLPLGWRMFLGVVPPAKSPDHTTAGSAKDPLSGVGAYDAGDGLRRRSRQVAELSKEDGARLTALLETLKSGHAIRFVDLTYQQQQSVVNLLVLSTLDLVCRSVTGATGIIHDQMWPYQRDPLTAVVSTKDGGISILTVLDSGTMRGETGFGASIPGAPRR